MRMNEYQMLAQRTSSTVTPEDKRVNAALGLCGESGQVTDYIKKCTYQGKKMDAAHIAEELGDVLWYVAELVTGMGDTISSVLCGMDDESMAFTDISYDMPENEKIRDMIEGSVKLCMYSSAVAGYCLIKSLTDAAVNHVGYLVTLIHMDIGRMAEMIGTNVDEIAEKNIAKLQTRYPDGFSVQRSENREE